MLGECVVGFCAYTDEEFAWLYVAPKMHRRGIGSKLVEHALKQESGLCCVEALSGNEPAKKLYESFGFFVRELISGKMPGNEEYDVCVYSMYRDVFIRKATPRDFCRIAEIEIFNYRLNFYPIFKNDEYYFEELQVASLIEKYESKSDADAADNLFVYDDGVVKGFIRLDGTEIRKLFVEPVLHSQGIGAKLLEFAVQNRKASFLWALEKNKRAIEFYARHGFRPNDEKVFEEGTKEYLVKLVR